CMGGDNAPREVVRGAVAAAADFSVDLTLVGDRAAIIACAALDRLDLSGFEIVDAPQTVTMSDDPLTVIKNKSESSMATALRMLSRGEGDALVSTGNTGALFTGATLIVRKIRGIKRPAIAGILPFANPVLLLDAGANINVNESYLSQFALMGSIYYSELFGVKRPRVGLINNGSEDCKGTEVYVKTNELLRASHEVNFIGNVEADRIPENVADVVVADGFTGNILLKSYEGMGRFAVSTLKELFSADTVTKVSGLLVKKKLSALRRRFDSGEYGGAPLLGIAGAVIKAHGSSDARAVKNAVGQAVSYASSHTIYNIAKRLGSIESDENPVFTSPIPLYRDRNGKAVSGLSETGN
ncbi:MAG: phosphate acyltransferase PlsX, partial [Clostridia bacterium]|nr:phosphate acyltransferase PlsX [Clostridia bacterium]